MCKVKVAVALTVMACCIWASAAPALAANEFYEVGNKAQIKGGTALFSVTGGSVTCASRSGTGSVASATQLKAELNFEACKTNLGTEAKISTCDLNANPEGKVAITSGCKITAGLCEVTFPAGEDKELKELGYAVINEAKGSLETEIFEVISNIRYEVSAGCEAVGLKSGKEGEFNAEPDVAKGAAVTQSHAIAVGGSGNRKLTLENNNSQVFTLPGTSGTITCGGMVFSGVKAPYGMAFTTLSFTNCLTTILGGSVTTTVEAVSGTGCKFFFLVFNAMAMTPQPGGGDLQSNTCVVRAKAMNCTIEIKGSVPQASFMVNFENTGVSPNKKIKVKFTSEYKFTYTASNNCGTVPAGGRVKFAGDDTVKGETDGGSSVDVSFL